MIGTMVPDDIAHTLDEQLHFLDVEARDAIFRAERMQQLLEALKIYDKWSRSLAGREIPCPWLIVLTELDQSHDVRCRSQQIADGHQRRVDDELRVVAA